MAEVDKVAILSLENAETWSHFFKQLVGKKAYKKKQSNRKKMVNIEPPTYILKHGSRNLEFSHLNVNLFNPRLIQLTMAFSKLAIIVYDHCSETALTQVNKLLALALTIKDAKQVVVVALANTDYRKSTPKTAGIHDRQISNSLQFHNVSSHIFLDLRCKRLKDMMQNFRSLLASKLQVTPANNPKQTCLKRERPSSLAPSPNVATLRKKYRAESPSNLSDNSSHQPQKYTADADKSEIKPVTAGTKQQDKQHGFTFFSQYRMSGTAAACEAAASATSALPAMSAAAAAAGESKNIFEEMLAKVNKTLKEDHRGTADDDTLNFTHIRVRVKRLNSHDSVCTPTPEVEHKSFNPSGFTMANRSETHRERPVSHNPSIKSLDSKMSKFMEACSAAQFRMRMLLPSSKPE